MNTEYKEYKVFDLFPGLGSMSLAAQYAGFKVEGALDYQEKVRDVYEKNFVGKVRIVNNFMEEDFIKDIADVDVLIGRIPYSLLRTGILRKDMARGMNRTNILNVLSYIVEIKRPRAFVFAMSVKAGKEGDWRHLMDERLAGDYKISWKQLDTHEMTGYPVYDRRIFLVGIHRDVQGTFLFPKGEYDYSCNIKDFLDDEAAVKDRQYVDHLYPEFDGPAPAKPQIYCWSSGQYAIKEKLSYNAWKSPLVRTVHGLRKMSNREIARTKAFPDEFCLDGSPESWMYRRLCDSVNVKVATAVFRQLFFCLCGVWPDESTLPDYIKREKSSAPENLKEKNMTNNLVTRYFKEETVQQYKSDIGFRTLVESVNENMYIIPKYQRKYRWKKEQLTGLVESLLRGLPIPPIYTCRNSANQLEILDGQQRVMSLFFYYIGYFLDIKKNSSINFSELEVEDSSFAEALLKKYDLEKLHINLHGTNGEEINVDYAALPVEIKRKVDYTMITVIEIKIAQEEKREEILQTIFSNLNKNGSILTRQEQRNGIYTCEFYDMLHSFNRENQKWRKLWGREDAKDRDVETLLRFCALKKYIYLGKKQDGGSEFKVEGYFDSYADMLDRFSKEAAAFQKEEIAEYRESLEGFVKLFESSNVLSAKVPLMEGFYVIYEKLGIRKKISRKLLDAVWNAPTYKENSRQRTVNIRKMRERWKTVYEVWHGCSG